MTVTGPALADVALLASLYTVALESDWRLVTAAAVILETVQGDVTVSGGVGTVRCGNPLPWRSSARSPGGDIRSGASWRCSPRSSSRGS